MLPTSHQVPTNAAGAAGPELLAEAFSEFISASARLELSYRDLQGEVQQLSRELADRNLALSASLAENDEMRRALEQILESMPCGVLVLEGDGAIRLANPEAARLLAIPMAQLRSLDDVLVARGVDLSLGQSDLAEDAAEQELAVHGPGGERWLAVRRRVLEGAFGDDAGAQAVLILRDVSVRRRLEAEREAARSAVALAEVSAMIAHEIRNPLASMELFAGLIADDAGSTAERAEWTSHLRAGIRAMSGTVDNVLTLHGAAPPASERVELRRELELAVDFLSPLARQASVSVSLAGGAEPMFLRSNKSALHQLVLNLCANALRHTPAGGWVRVAAERRPRSASFPVAGSILVSVADNGCGVPAEFRSQLFHNRFSGSGSSPGLGLAVCGRLMRQHGGSIAVESEPGRGSTFLLEFPAL